MAAEDGPDDGRGFLRDMAAQSARAHEFDRRLRWSRLSKQLRENDEVVAHVAAHPDQPGETDPATSSAAPAVPDQRR